MAAVDDRCTLERFLDEIGQRDERSSEFLPLLPLRPNSRGRPPTKGTVPLHVGLGSRALPWLSLNDCDKSEGSGNEQTLGNEREVAPRVVVDAELECSGVVDNFSSEDIYDKYQQHHPCILAELLNEIHKKEASLKEKEHIAHLKQQIQEYKTRCSNYELQMKSMKKSYMKELTPLQSNIDAQIIEDKGSAETQLPDGTESTLPIAFDVMEVRKTNKPRSTLLHLLKEFDQETEIVDDDAEMVSEVRQPDGNTNFDEEFPEYKSSFWKNLKVRLRKVNKAFIELVSSKKEAGRRWTCAVRTR